MDFTQILRATYSANSEERIAAESHLDQVGSANPGPLLEALFAIIVDSTAPVNDAQAAALVLKNLVVKHWNPGFEQFTGPQWSSDVKAVLRNKLIEVVEQSNRPLITSATSSVIARIGALEYPDEWPDLVSKSVNMLGADSTRGAGLSLFKELLIDTVREYDFFEFGDTVLLRLFEATHHPEHLLSAIRTFHECINFFLMGDDDQLPMMEQVASQYIHQWNALFGQLILDNQNIQVQFEINNTLRDLQSAFPGVMVDDIPTLFERVFTRLESQSTEYTSQTLVARSDFKTPDGAQGFDPELISAQIDFLERAIESKAGRTILKSFNELEQLNHVIGLCITYAQIPNDLQNIWASDFNDFVTHEVELAEDVLPRPSAGSLVGVLRNPNLIKALLLKAQSPRDWVELEAILFLLSSALQQIAIESQTLSPEDIDDILKIVQYPHHEELLAARATITCGYLSKYLNNRISNTKKLELISRALTVADSSSSIVLVGSLRTIAIGCELFPNELKQYQNQFLMLISSLVAEAEEDTPAFLVDIFSNVLQLDFDSAIRIDDVFKLFFALVGKGTENIELNVELLSVAEEMLNDASDKPDSLRLVFQQLLKPIVDILSHARETSFEFSSDLQFSLDLATVAFERGADIPNRRELLDIFFELVSRSEDNQILQSGSFAYAALLERVGSNELDEPAIQKVLGVAAKLLDPKLDDQAALASGRLVTAIIENFGLELQSITNDIILATARRLSTAENVLLAESLTLVFAELFNKDAQAVVNLLADYGLVEVVLKKWLTTFEIVRGIDEIYKSITSLQRIFELHDQRVDCISIDNEPIAPKNMILTRSKTKNLKFTQVPLPLKIIKLLIKELSQAPVPDEEDDEWDDELALGLDGQNPVDHRTYKLILEWFKKVGDHALVWYPKLTESERTALMEAARDFNE